MLRHGRNQISLADGRRLVFSLAGPAGGIPVIYCHGAIGTALQTSVDLESMAAELGVRYVAVCRPGIGGSDPAPGRDLLSFANDVEQLADVLSLPSFGLVGVSAGGPYALAIAHRLAPRVTGAAVCSSLSPLATPHRAPGMRKRIRLPLALLARAPDLCEAVGELALPVIRRHPRLLSGVIAAHAAPEERHLLRRPGERAAAGSSFLTATEDGVRGMIDDYLVCTRPWGFDPAQVTATVQLWHGARDPLVHALALSVTLPHSELFVAADEGHHFFRRRLREILARLVGREAATGTLDAAPDRAA